VSYKTTTQRKISHLAQTALQGKFYIFYG